jgi:type I restriction enzyme S subunit
MGEISTSTLESMCELVIDCPHFTPKWTESGYIVIRNQNIRDGRLDLTSPSYTHAEDYARRIKRAKPAPGDIIFTREAPMGEVCMVPKGLTCCVGQRQVLLRPKSSVNGRYLLFALRSHFVRHQIRWNEGTGSTVSNVRIPVLKALRIPRLGAAEGSIADLLGALDDKIELNRQTNETLEALARAIFKDWFVDFGPTRAKAEGHAPYLAPELWDLFPDRLDAEGKPEGWEVKPFSDFFSIIGGGTPKKSVAEYWNGDILWFSVVDAPPTGEIYVVDAAARITEKGLDESSARLVRAGTTIISARGTVGKLAIARRDMTFNQSCYGLQGQEGVGDRFVYLSAEHMVGRLQAMAHGSVFSTITRDTFAALDFVRASDALLAAFEEAVQPLFERIGAHVEESRTLAQTRDLLLPKLMSGEIRLRDAERMVEDAA